MVRFEDGDLDYHVYNGIQTAGVARTTKHFLNNDHWMDDNSGGSLGGAMLRPNKSFKF